jgi:hypothetical protein
MPYAFRVRFRMPHRAHLPSIEKELRVSEAEDVSFSTGATEQPLKDAEWVLLIGRGYESSEAATEAAARWRGYVERGFARANVPADFDAQTGVMTFAYEKELTEQAGVPVMTEMALNVFEEDPWPRFVRSQVEGIVGRSLPVTLGSIRRAAELDLRVPERDALAFNLFSASFARIEEDARFIMLMMSVETLITLDPRAPDVRAHAEKLLALTRDAAIPVDEQKSITGSLKWLFDESINQGGRRLARERLDGREYANEPPDTFFSKCYSIRSGLVHGEHPRPDASGRVAQLQQFVADLLSAELLEAVDIHALAEQSSDGG